MTWRLAGRVRLLADRLPRLSRMTRQVLKFAYWTLTLRLFDRLSLRRQARQGIAMLSSTPLFDRDWYLTRYEDLLPPGTDPVTHYYWTGAAQGLDPHPLFDTSWYADATPERGRINPLVHYLARRGRGTADPHPLFDTGFYLGQAAARDCDPAITPLEHFLDAGSGAAQPNPLLDQRLYAEEYLGGVQAAGGALLHYVTEGEAAGLWPHPLFDPQWYADAHPDSHEAGPLAHYLRFGGREAQLACSVHMQRLAEPVTLPVALDFEVHDAPRVSIIVPVYGHAYETWRCLATLKLTTVGVSYEVILADDRPGRPVSVLLTGSGIKTIVNSENKGFLSNCNSAARIAVGDQLLFLNSDTTLIGDWLRPLSTVMDADARVGVVGCKLLNADGSVQEAGGIIYGNGWGDSFGKADDAGRGCYNYVRDVDVVTGACFLVRRDLFDRIGGFDSRYSPAFYEEFDLATTARNMGYRVVYQPLSEVYHHGSASYGTEQRDRQTSRNHAVFCRKWATLLAVQPASDTPSFLARERPSPRGVILVIDDKVPEIDKHAGAVTLFQYLGLLRELGMRVIYAPHDGDPMAPYTRMLEQRGIEVLHRPDTLHGWLRRYGAHLDVIWTARPDVTTPILPWLKAHSGARILYYTHDLHYLRELRRYQLEGSAWALQESHRLKPLELSIFAQVDWVMTPSAEEAEEIRAEVPLANVAVIPPYLYGEGSGGALTDDLAARTDILFIGGFDHTPNVDAAIWLVEAIMPLIWAQRPQTTAWIVGNAPPDEVRALAGPRVQVTGFVRELEPYLARARVSLSPLRYGAGVKGKIVTSLQAGIPVVTTPCGNEGIRLVDGTEALIGETAHELAEASLRILDDAGLSERLSRAGVEVVRQRFSKDMARQSLLRLLGSRLCGVCGARPRQTPRRQPGEWREQVHCLACGALNRSAALAEVLMLPYRRLGVNVLGDARVLLEGLRIHEFGHTGALRTVFGVLPGFTASDHVEGLAPGAAWRDGICNEDIQNLSFEDASIDLLVSQDVKEHVADPWRGFAEIHRVLRPGGRHVFTIPFNSALPVSRVRAVIEAGALRHIEPPQYHGDPRRAEGALVFTDFGADFAGRLREIGLDLRVHAIDDPEAPGCPILVFEAIRPPAT